MEVIFSSGKGLGNCSSLQHCGLDSSKQAVLVLVAAFKDLLTATDFQISRKGGRETL